MARPWILAVLIVFGIVASISMIVLGWPESTPTQVTMLELAALPLQAALALGLWRLRRQASPLSGAGLVALRFGAGLVGLGLVLAALAYLSGPRGMVHLGLALVWVGLLAAMVVIITHLPRRRLRADPLFTVLAEDDEDDPAPGPDDEDDPGPGSDDTGDQDPDAAAPVAGPQDRSVESPRD